MINVFLSASVPLPERDRRFFDTADVLAIREAIKALVEVVLPDGHITCGGHPAITPLLALFIRDAKLERRRVTIFQSEYFKTAMPKEVDSFVDVRLVPSVHGDCTASLTAMRRAMISSRKFSAAVIIGGMEGVLEECKLFSMYHPNAKVLPIASTGAAAAIIHKTGNYDQQLAYDLTYPSLFRRRLTGLPYRE